MIIAFHANVSASDPSCAEQGEGNQKVVLTLDDFTTKLIPENEMTQEQLKASKAPTIVNYFNFTGPSLYCDYPTSSGLCNEKSIWFTYEEFVKFKALYKPVLCSNLSYQNKSGKITQTLTIYLYANQKLNRTP